jgi:hypothetical protein
MNKTEAIKWMMEGNKAFDSVDNEWRYHEGVFQYYIRMDFEWEQEDISNTDYELWRKVKPKKINWFDVGKVWHKKAEKGFIVTEHQPNYPENEYGVDGMYYSQDGMDKYFEPYKELENE